ncbi:MAG: HemK2/MTQ2 family protein methyltransferase [Methanoregulaceae archaeon]
MFDSVQVYQPSDDTYLLAAAAMEEARPEDRVIEIGTGSGYVSSVVQPRVCSLVATDLNPLAVLAARSRGIEVVRTDLAQGICGTFSLVLFNPPYLPTRPEERIDDWLEHALDGGPEGRTIIERFAREAGAILAPNGRILLLVSSLTGIDAVRAIFRDEGMRSEVARTQTLEDGEELVVLRITAQFW